jgi:hypothetical protein
MERCLQQPNARAAQCWCQMMWQANVSTSQPEASTAHLLVVAQSSAFQAQRGLMAQHNTTTSRPTCMKQARAKGVQIAYKAAIHSQRPYNTDVMTTHRCLA